ncbi:helix-turn-helix domain-containing protein [Nonomuraea sp. NN258]|uniref:helix-turn-helix domain-containing protein n=1 Tax=Nonomuraea antri TaxID=2730852 RepID=UPI001569C3A2|nr:helix-turn-helix domain-containing protein [Nonomuraea antri]NRQ38318.1 helix-turn-helix domain-containing protein [Nonomuraea antri]
MEEQSIGAALAAARQSAGLTVAQVSEATRIRVPIIQAMEQDDFGQCGGGFYARGHLKAVAKAVGLDPEATVHLFDQQHGGAPQPVRAASVFQADRQLNLRERHGPNWTMALGVALAIVVVFGVIRVVGGAGDRLPAAEVNPASGVPTPSPAATVTASPARAAQSTRNMVVVRVQAKRSSFVTVRDAEGRKLFSGTLKAGKISTWRSPQRMNVLLGDAGAVFLQVNGKDMGKVGRRGEIVRRTFGVPTPPPR